METLELKKALFDTMNAVAFGLSIDHQYTKKAWADAIGIKETRLLCDFWPTGEISRKVRPVHLTSWDSRAEPMSSWMKRAKSAGSRSMRSCMFRILKK